MIKLDYTETVEKRSLNKMLSRNHFEKKRN